MRLNVRIGKLENHCPVVVARWEVPTGSFADFVAGFLAGTFTFEDIDPTDFAQTGFAGRLNALLVCLTPEHRAWCDANPWAPSPEQTWAECVRRTG
jgi:hypothetical protein